MWAAASSWCTGRLGNCWQLPASTRGATKQGRTSTWQSWCLSVLGLDCFLPFGRARQDASLQKVCPNLRVENCMLSNAESRDRVSSCLPFLNTGMWLRPPPTS
eukprot:6088366-Alexandrium_andersonii.AAC.1